MPSQSLLSKLAALEPQLLQLAAAIVPGASLIVPAATLGFSVYKTFTADDAAPWQALAAALAPFDDASVANLNAADAGQPNPNPASETPPPAPAA